MLDKYNHAKLELRIRQLLILNKLTSKLTSIKMAMRVAPPLGNKRKKQCSCDTACVTGSHIRTTSGSLIVYRILTIHVPTVSLR